MTNLEWIRTLSEEEFADWLYDEWLHHLQYRWSSSRGGLIIWLKDRKTEPTGYNLSPVDKDINVRSKDEAQLSEIPTSKCHYEPKDEPTTQIKTQNSNKNSNVISVYDGVSEAVRCAMCNNPNKSDRGCDGACLYDEALYKKIIDAIHKCQYEPKDEPQTDCPWK